MQSYKKPRWTNNNGHKQQSVKVEGIPENLLNTTIPDSPTSVTTYQGAEPFIKNITQEEINVAVGGLKNWKAPGSDNIQSELLKYGGKKLQTLLFRLFDKIWIEERMQQAGMKQSSYRCIKKGIRWNVTTIGAPEHNIQNIFQTY